MADSTSVAPPPPPPPPPPISDNNSNASSVPNGPSINQTPTAQNGTSAVSTGDGTKPWERAWSVDEMRKGATSWSLASDSGVTILQSIRYRYLISSFVIWTSFLALYSVVNCNFNPRSELLKMFY